MPSLTERVTKLLVIQFFRDKHLPRAEKLFQQNTRFTGDQHIEKFRPGKLEDIVHFAFGQQSTYHFFQHTDDAAAILVWSYLEEKGLFKLARTVEKLFGPNQTQWTYQLNKNCLQNLVAFVLNKTSGIKFSGSQTSISGKGGESGTHQTEPHGQISQASTQSNPLSTQRKKLRCRKKPPRPFPECLSSDDDTQLGLYVENVKDKGRGVFTSIARRRNDAIVEYVGHRLNAEEAKVREFCLSQTNEAGGYFFYFNWHGQKYCIDSSAETGRLGRLLNHSCKNFNLKPKLMTVENMPRIVFFASRDIKPGEELLFDYGDRRRSATDAEPWLFE